MPVSSVTLKRSCASTRSSRSRVRVAEQPEERGGALHDIYKSTYIDMSIVNLTVSKLPRTDSVAFAGSRRQCRTVTIEIVHVHARIR